MTAPGAGDPHSRPQPDGSDIVRLADADVSRAATALARAFYDDPVASWMYRDESARHERLERGFALFMRRVWLPVDASYTTDSLAGAALWMPPGEWHLGFLAQLRMLPAMWAVSRRDLPRLLGFFNAMESVHPENPHWYLPIVGVEPEWQGKGFGAALLRPILERCDAEGVPAYLEASSMRSRALYERQGFEVSGDEITAKDSPPLWPMWREPRPKPAVAR